MTTYIRSELGENDSTATLRQVGFEDTFRIFSVRGNQFAALQPAQVCLKHDFLNLGLIFFSPSERNMTGLILSLR